MKAPRKPGKLKLVIDLIKAHREKHRDLSGRHGLRYWFGKGVIWGHSVLGTREKVIEAVETELKKCDWEKIRKDLEKKMGRRQCTK